MRLLNKLFPCKYGRCKDKPFGCNCGTFIGLSAGAIGTAALMGGGAYLLTRKRKQKDIPEYGGMRPFSSLREIPETAGFLEELQRRKRGEGVGFRPEVLSAATSPFAATQRASLKERTIPQISQQASARGLGRSTIPVGQIGQASGATERDIGERIAELQLANEQQRRAEINQALSGIGGFIGQEASTRAGRAGFDIGDFGATRGLNIQADQFNQQMQQQDIQNMLALGQLGVSAFKPQASLFKGANITLPAQDGLGNITNEEMDFLRKNLAATVTKS